MEKVIASVCRKLARQHAEDLDGGSKDHPDIKLTPNLVEKLLGSKKYGDDFYHKEPCIGVSLGLAYTTVGGEVLPIEASLIPAETFKLVLTGKLGDVMKESAQAALSFVRTRSAQFGIDLNTLSKNELHIHVPAGAVPKDGPSAGIAIATAILSCFLQEYVAPSIAMTGEITIHGKVLPIGGLKEKLLAAQREGVTTVLIPNANRSHYSELPANLKRKLKVKFVTDYSDAFVELFPEVLIHNVPIQSMHRPHEKDLAS